MKKLLVSTLAVSALAAVAIAAPPTPTFVKNINVGTVCQAPVDVIEVAGDLYVVGFNDQKVAKVSNPIGTEVVSLFKDVSTAATWGAGRGPQGIMFDNNEFYITGDTGSNGFIGVYNAAGVQQRLQILTGTRIVDVASLDVDSLVVGRSLSTALLTYKKSDLTDEANQTILADDGYRSPIRKIYVDSTGVVYYASGGDLPIGNSIGKFTPGSTPGALSTYTFAPFFAPNEAQDFPATIGIAPFSRGADNWILFVNIGGFGGALPSIDFVNKATGLRDLKFVDATNINGNIRGVVTANIGGTDYMFVANSSSADPLAPNQVHVYSLGASSVADWSIY